MGSSEFTPIIPGFYSDPTICRVGDDYYLSTSSFEYFPGAPIFHSSDLVTWTQIGHILTRRDQFLRGDGGASRGIYGSTLRHHGGRFWFVTTNFCDDEGGQVLVVSAANPEGPWSVPVVIAEAMGIDPDLAWDGDDCYLTWRSFDFEAGADEIRQVRLDLQTGAFRSEPTAVWQGSGLDNAEAPHLFKIGEWWYLLLAEGGTERGHSVTVARSARPAGPWEPHPDNPIFTRSGTVHPVQNTGHADLVRTPSGGWAAVYLAVRPRGSVPGYHVNGRETFVARIDWVDGWPSFAADGFEVSSQPTAFDDDFSRPDLDFRWVVPGGEAENLVTTGAAGLSFLTWARPDDVLCARVRDSSWSAEVDVVHSGLVQLRIDHRHRYGIELRDGVVRVIVQIGDIETTVADLAIPAESATLSLRSVAPDDRPVPLGHAGPDVIELSCVVDGRRHELARLDGRYLSTEVASGFTGRMIALGGLGPESRIAAVRYRGTEP